MQKASFNREGDSQRSNSHGICLNSGLFKASYGEALYENTCEIEFCD